MALIDLANPTRFLNLAHRALPWLAEITAAVFVLGLYLAYGAPDDYQQGATVKIMFLHVPSAWLGMFGWLVMSVAALGTLVWRHPLADVAAKAAAPIGAAFTFMCLVTGSLWGRPMWGTYWVWDARLTSVLILFLMYLGASSRGALSRSSRAARTVAILTLISAINLPIIKFSVALVTTLRNRRSVLRLDGPSVYPETILIPLLVMTLAFTLLFMTLHLAASGNEILREHSRAAADACTGVWRRERHEPRSPRRFHHRSLRDRRPGHRRADRLGRVRQPRTAAAVEGARCARRDAPLEPIRMSAASDSAAPVLRRRLIVLLPLIGFLALAGLFLFSSARRRPWLRGTDRPPVPNTPRCATGRGLVRNRSRPPGIPLPPISTARCRWSTSGPRGVYPARRGAAS